MDAFTVVFGGTLAFFVIMVVLLGLFSDRSPREDEAEKRRWRES